MDSSEELTASLEKLATRAARPFTAIGKPVAGTPTPEGAPVITAGDWLDELGTTEDELTKNYEVKRETPGSTVHVSASLRTNDSSGEKVEVRRATPDGTDCGYGGNFTQLSAGQLISAGASDITRFGDIEEDSPCTSADYIIATVVNDATKTSVARPLEFRVIEEPPARNPERLPEAATGATWTPPPTGGPARKVTGGSSFDDAPLLKPGTYQDAIVPGEVLTYQVDADWGQDVSATVDCPQAPTKLTEAVGNADRFARLDIFGPTRAAAGVTGSAGSPTSQAFVFGSAQGGQQFGIVTTAVTYLNRGGQQPQAGASLAGRYTITFFMEPDPQRESYLVPFTLHVGVNGQPVRRLLPATVDA